MKNKDLQATKSKSVSELMKASSELKSKINTSALELRLGRTKNVHESRSKRRDLAQILTVLNRVKATDKEKITKGDKNGSN